MHTDRINSVLEVRCSCGALNSIRSDPPIITWICGHCKKPLSGNGGSVSEGSECIICNKGPCHENILVNGVAYHEECYQDQLSLVSYLNKKISICDKERSSLAYTLKSADSLSYKIRKFFGGEEINKNTLIKKIQELDTQIKSCSSELKKTKANIEYLYDYWPTYPPDWDERVDLVRSRDKQCCYCDTQRKLHVHHYIKIGDGGNHLFSNLILLCEDCHKQDHGTRKFSGSKPSKDGKPSQFSKKVSLINEAIYTKSFIRFNYRKWEGEKSRRTIQPSLIKQVGKSLCVQGWCYLRNENRTFAIKRMSKIQQARDSQQKDVNKIGKGLSFSLSFARKDYRCHKTNKAIKKGEYHFVDHKGRRYSIESFRDLYPERAQMLINEKNL